MWAGDPILRGVLAGVVMAAVATIVGVVALWPTGEGRRTAVANADEIGLVTDRLSATVEEVLDRRCSYSTDEDPQDCRTLTLIVHEGPEAGAVVTLPEINLLFDHSAPDLAVGDRVVLGYEDSTNSYFYADHDRRTSLVWLVGLFAVVVIALGVLIGFVAGSLICNFLAGRYQNNTLIVTGLLIMLAGSLLLSLSSYVGLMTTHLSASIIPIMVIFSGIAFVIPVATAEALAPFEHVAGSASAMLGFFEMGLASASTGVMSSIPLDSAYSMPIVFTGLSVLGLLVFVPFIMMRKNRARAII